MGMFPLQCQGAADTPSPILDRRPPPRLTALSNDARRPAQYAAPVDYGVTLNERAQNPVDPGNR
jgi:hypothetical protein